MKKQAKKTFLACKHCGLARTRPSALTEAAQLARWNDRRLKFGRKFAVLIYGVQDRMDFHLFASETEARYYYLEAANACHIRTEVRDAHGEYVKVLAVRLYQVDCDGEDLARNRIARGNAVRLYDTGDPYAAREHSVPRLFRTVQ